MADGDDRARPDGLARVLEAGLVLIVLGAPLPFGSVVPAGLRLIEILAGILGLVWLARLWRAGRQAVPGAALSVALGGLLLLGMLQLVPLPGAWISRLSPAASAMHQATTPSGAALAAERRMVGVVDEPDETAKALSLDPAATASALRLGAALVTLLLVATSVAAVCGLRRVALALIVSAAFQSLYGLWVLASGHDRIWHLPKVSYLDSATGSFVNRNHFACFLAMSLACGAALVLERLARAVRSRRTRWAVWFGGAGSRNLMLALLLALALAGLLASLSRAGIAIGLAALVVTLLVAGRFLRPRLRVALTLILLSLAAIPWWALGSERLIARYAESAESLAAPSGRLQVWGDTARMAAAHPASGTGFGTFAAAYPAYRSPRVRLFYAHAHNDLVQLAAEGGLPGLLLLVLALAVLGARTLRGLRGGYGALGVGFSAGLLAVLVHALVDFNFHIPANAALAAILAGALEGLHWRSPI